jgi:hypothetical protein
MSRRTLSINPMMDDAYDVPIGKSLLGEARDDEHESPGGLLSPFKPNVSLVQR